MMLRANAARPFVAATWIRGWLDRLRRALAAAWRWLKAEGTDETDEQWWDRQW
jgi:hypothetical protein